MAKSDKKEKKTKEVTEKVIQSIEVGADVDMEDELGRAITGDVEPEEIGEAIGT